MSSLLYVSSPSRRHKLKPLLVDGSVVEVKGFRGLLDISSNGAYSLVLIDSFGRWGMWGLIASIRLRVPLVIRMRGDFFSEARWRYRNHNALLGFPRYFVNVLIGYICLKLSKGIIFNSHYLESQMKEWVTGRNVAVIYNPYTPVFEARRGGSDVPAISDKSLVLLSIANMVLPPKVDPIINQLKIWPRKFWVQNKLHWVICGDGPLRSKILRVVDELDIGEFVSLPGHVSNIGGYFRRCNIFVHLSNMDAFPNVTLEAMMYQKPVVTNTKSCGTREQVYHNRNGLIVEEGASIQAALEQYIADPAMRFAHGKAGKEIVEAQFSVETQRVSMANYLKLWLESNNG